MMLRSFEETLTLVGAVVVAAIAYWLFGATALTTLVAGLIAAVGIAYATSFEFTLSEETVRVRSRFHERTMPIKWIQKASVKTFWGGLARQVLHVPSAPSAGTLGRLFSTHGVGNVAKPRKMDRGRE
jgi:hypothetical protein